MAIYVFPVLTLMWFCFNTRDSLYASHSTISLEMPVSSQGHYGFHSFPVVDWFCLFLYFECWLSLWKIVRSSVILLLPLCINNMCTLLSILFYFGPLCVPYLLFCFIMDQHVYRTLYCVLLWTIMCTLLSIFFYYGPLCVPRLSRVWR